MISLLPGQARRHDATGSRRPDKKHPSRRQTSKISVGLGEESVAMAVYLLYQRHADLCLLICRVTAFHDSTHSAVIWVIRCLVGLAHVLSTLSHTAMESANFDMKR